jgi:sphinganine-1-phosphate aldolase
MSERNRPGPEPCDRLPEAGWDADRIRSHLVAAKAGDADWRSGRIWSLVYYGGEAHTDFLVEIFRLYASENPLSPSAFPSLRGFERDIIAMLRGLLGGDERVAGTMTSGGTESILLAVKTYRDRARERGRDRGAPELILPASAHPAFLKAAQYFDVKPVIVPVGEDFRADPAAMAAAITERTILLVGSAPCFPYGVVDPIAELGALAEANGLGLHVDACVGGFILPFAADLGRTVPAFDFSVPGVTSISADLHKYGYALKGASAILYREAGLRRHQFFVDTGWPGGLFGSPAMLGTRPGGIIAAAWAALMKFGHEGYRDLACRTFDLTDRLKAGIAAIPGLHIVGEPDMTVFAFGSETLDIFAVADRMTARGWHLDRQARPKSIHLVVTPNHEAAIAAFLSDLATAVGEAGQTGRPATAQSAMLYGVTTNVAGGDDPRSAVIRELERSLDA